MYMPDGADESAGADWARRCSIISFGVGVSVNDSVEAPLFPPLKCLRCALVVGRHRLPKRVCGRAGIASRDHA